MKQPHRNRLDLKLIDDGHVRLRAPLYVARSRQLQQRTSRYLARYSERTLFDI
jgi:hypothetical protein